ncbi:UDP-N-acetylmuramate dehydrogenase [Kitasatospora aureofaciens]|uniref:UDP-N-acetylmuramate dehydrogenase n=1 Tax=Kitasatospora aureofaciens TaxID=1894 RepID=UPI001C436E39|nr:UDP-N-acetylmuramate dehydrogenase [Kitasatospora aureofaciens]MBV6699954.1 UDP-N-acetylmuramate dehydrogenase [Kitasatospora aureofaciens]
MAPISLASLTTLRLGGPAERVLTVSDPADWAEAARSVDQREGMPVVLGHGSNVIASDAGHPGTVVVMRTRGITTTRVDENTVAVTAQAGHPLTDLVAWAAAEHLAGIECLAGIPGTAGAAPVQNAGAYGQQIADTLDHITAWDWQTNRPRTLPAQACRFHYRQSRFKAEPGRWTILTVTLHLTRCAQAEPVTYQHLADELGLPLGARPPVREVTAAVLANRRRRGLLLDPLGPDARQVGSVFLNPPVSSADSARWSAAGCPVHTTSDGQLRASAAWFLEQAGYGPAQFVLAGVRCSARRTLTLTAEAACTAAGFTAALDQMATRVLLGSGILLSVEPVQIDVQVPPTLPGRVRKC